MLACDGIWDCVTNIECMQKLVEQVDLIKKLKHKDSFGDKTLLSKPVEKLFTKILAEDSADGLGTDNMTAILIYFHNNLEL